MESPLQPAMRSSTMISTWDITVLIEYLIVTREESHPMGPLKKAEADVIVNRHDPSDTNAMVLIPAGRSCIRSSISTLMNLARVAGWPRGKATNR